MLVDNSTTASSTSKGLASPLDKAHRPTDIPSVPPQHPSRLRHRTLVQPRDGPAAASTRPSPVLVIHGGASGGTLPPDIPPELEESYRSALALALQRGYAILEAGGSALDAVTEAVKSMEDDDLFNAGHGAVLNLKGEIECEASVMCSQPLPGTPRGGDTNEKASHVPVVPSDPKFDVPPPSQPTTHFPSSHRRYAAATNIRNTKNPITLARALYLHPSMAPHAFFAGNEAEEIGWRLGTEKVDGQSYYWTRRRWEEHRKALGLPFNVDPADCDSTTLCTDSNPSPTAPPPTYDSLTRSSGQARSSASAASEWHDSSSIQALPGSDIGRASVSDVDGFSNESRARTRTRVTPASGRTSLDVRTSDMSSSSSSSWSENEKTTSDTDGNEADVDSRASVDSSSRPDSFGGAAQQQRRKRFMPMGTVGAVALDVHGRVASATSTGGTTNKVPGRIGDTPSAGAGFWAETWDANEVPGSVDEGSDDEEEADDDEERGRPNGCGDAFRRAIKALFGVELIRADEGRGEKKKGDEGRLEAGDLRCAPSGGGEASLGRGHHHGRDGRRRRPRALALSATGTGDVFLRLSFASLVSHRRKLLGQPLVDAVEQAVKEMGHLEGEGGCIALGERGEVVMRCNTQAMNRGFISRRTKGKPHVAIWAKEDCRPWNPPSHH